MEEVRGRLARIEERLQPAPMCMTYPEAAKRLGIGLTLLREMVARHELRTATVGKRRMVPLSEIERVSQPKAPKARRAAVSPRTRKGRRPAPRSPAEEAAALRAWMKKL